VCCPCINCITGSPQDQAKVRQAIANQRVDPADIPLTAKAAAPTISHVIPSTSQPPAPSQKKRKAAFEQAAHTNSQLKPAVPVTTRSIIHDVDDDDEVTILEPDPVDELYCTLRTSIVGVQYYKGEFSRRLSRIYPLMRYSKASSVPERKLGYLENRIINMTGIGRRVLTSS
jgi:hypothetical protein